MSTAGLATPTGKVWVTVEDGSVTACGWGPCDATGDDPVLDQALQELDAYFSGDRQVFSVPLAPRVSGLTARVLAVMREIPFGDTMTYGDIAKELDAPPQAVGQACGANPIPIFIPCHRVLSATGLGGFSGASGVETKVALLKHEGAASLLL